MHDCGEECYGLPFGDSQGEFPRRLDYIFAAELHTGPAIGFEVVVVH